MKTLFTFLFLSVSFSSIANAACYVTEDIFPSLPKEICIENMAVDLNAEILNIGQTNGVIPSSLPTHYLARRNENGYSFKASHLLVDSWPGGCESGETVVLTIRGKTDNDGLVEYVEEIAADYKFAFDSCHSREREGRAIYKLK